MKTSQFAILVFLFVINFGLPKELQVLTNFKNRKSRQIQRKGDIGQLIDDSYVLLSHPKNINKGRSRQKRFIAFPAGAKLSVESALSLLRYSTADDYETPLRIVGKRSAGDEDSLDAVRRFGYQLLEKSFYGFGLPGTACLQRVICEVAHIPIMSLGLLGELFNMFFAVGHMSDVRGLEKYVLAEEEGLQHANCSSYFISCPIDVLELLSGMPFASFSELSGTALLKTFL